MSSQSRPRAIVGTTSASNTTPTSATPALRIGEVIVALLPRCKKTQSLLVPLGQIISIFYSD
jgi:hypothetical protein